jgi:hypothetical protein
MSACGLVCPQALAKSGFINYYGMQRFGSYGEPTSAIGEEWICVTTFDLGALVFVSCEWGVKGVKRGSRLLTPPVVESDEGVAMLKRNWKAVVDYVMRPRLGEEQRVADVRTYIHVYNMYIYTWIVTHFEVDEESLRRARFERVAQHVMPCFACDTESFACFVLRRVRTSTGPRMPRARHSGCPTT